MSNSSPLFQTEALSKHFGKIKAVDEIDIKIYPSEINCIIGPNGAGKTTFSRLITGSLRPTDGSVYFKGNEITPLKENERVQQGIVRSFQRPELYEDLTVFENIRASVLINKRDATSMTKFFHPSAETQSKNFTNSLLNNFNISYISEKKAKNLSRGNKKIVDIVMAFATDPELVILDEPTSGVGTSEKTDLIETVLSGANKRNATLVIIEHDIEIVESKADRLIAMADGKILRDGDPREVLGAEQVMNKILSEGF